LSASRHKEGEEPEVESRLRKREDKQKQKRKRDLRKNPLSKVKKGVFPRVVPAGQEIFGGRENETTRKEYLAVAIELKNT